MAASTDVVTEQVFPLTIGGMTASELVHRGAYDRSNWAICWDDLFRIEPHDPEERVIKLITFVGHNPTTDELLAEFERMGLERPTPEGALTFGVDYPDEQRKRQIVFLHEPVQVDGHRCILVLDGYVWNRSLRFSRFDEEWHRNYVFAAVRK